MTETKLETEPAARTRSERYVQGAAMLRDWIAESDLEDESGYDWEAIESELDDAGMRCRETDDESQTK